MPYISIFLMIFLAIAMFWGQKQYKTKRVEWGKFLTIVCGFLIIFLALSTMMCSTDEATVYRAMEKEYQAIKAEGLAKALVKRRNGKAGGKALIIVPSSAKTRPESIAYVIEGLKKGFGSAITITTIESPQMPASLKSQNSVAGIPEEYEMPIEEWLTAEVFDKIINNNPECNVVVSLIGLPQSIDELYSLRFFDLDKDNKKYATASDRPLLGVLNANIHELKVFLLEKLITVLVVHNPAAKFDAKPPPSDFDEAFKKRFVLLDFSNVEEFNAKNPDYFRADEE